MPCVALLPKRRLELLVDFLFTEAAEQAGSLSCRNPPRLCAVGQPEAEHGPPQDDIQNSDRGNGASHPWQAGARPSCSHQGSRDQGPLLSQAPRVQGQELGPAGSGGPGPPPAPRRLASRSFHLVKASCSIATAGKRCLSSSRPCSPLGELRERQTLGTKGRVAVRPHRREQPHAPRLREACTNPGDNVSCLFTGWSRPGWLQHLAPSSHMLQCWERTRGRWPSRGTVGAVRGCHPAWSC